MPNVGKSKMHGSYCEPPKGKRQPDTGAKMKHGSMGDKFDKSPPSGPNNPNATASGKPKNYEGGSPSLQRSAAKKNYAENPKHLKQ